MTHLRVGQEAHRGAPGCLRPDFLGDQLSLCLTPLERQGVPLTPPHHLHLRPLAQGVHHLGWGWVEFQGEGRRGCNDKREWGGQREREREGERGNPGNKEGRVSDQNPALVPPRSEDGGTPGPTSPLDGRRGGPKQPGVDRKRIRLKTVLFSTSLPYTF